MVSDDIRLDKITEQLHVNCVCRVIYTAHVYTLTTVHFCFNLVLTIFFSSVHLKK